MPEFEPDDAQVYLEVYKNADPEEDFGHFEDQREANIERLRGLPAEAGNRKAMHRAAGQITLSQMMHEWALHAWGTSGRSRSWSARASTWRARGRWAGITG